MTDIPGFARAQRAYENQEPYDPDWCECVDQEVYVCGTCGEPWPQEERSECPDCDGDEGGRTLADAETLVEQYPVQSCHKHADNEPDWDTISKERWIDSHD